MSKTGNDSRRAAIRAALARRAGEDADARAVAEAALHTWQEVVAQLAPVIGERGVDVLISRSLHLMSLDFPCLALAGNSSSGADQLTNFRICIEDRPPAVAAEASYILLVTFTDLLASLIGESLTERLLNPIWIPPPAVAKQERMP